MQDSELTPPFTPYGGPLPYVFVSYSHEDRASVYPEILRLHRQGYRLWYDEGIDAGREWPEEIARRLDAAAVVLFFVSPRFVSSRNCRNEIHFALDRDKSLLAVHLEETELPPGLALQVGSIQAISRYRIGKESFAQKLVQAFSAHPVQRDVDPGAEQSESALEKTASDLNPNAVASSSKARLALMAAGTVLVLGLWWILGDRLGPGSGDQGVVDSEVSGGRSDGSDTALETQAASGIADPPQLAVMSIEDKTGSEELAKAGIGSILSDAFVQILEGSGEIHLVSPVRLDSVLRQLGRSFEETASDIELAVEVCSEAEANLLLTGSLSQLGESFVLSATLTELPSQSLVGHYQARASGQEALLDALTGQIAEHLRKSIHENYGRELGKVQTIGKVATSDLQAYASFIRGLDYSWEGYWQESIEELEAAVDLDPQMALAWSQLGCAYSFAGDQDFSRAAQLKAEELVDRLSEKEALFVRCKSLWIEDGSGDRFVSCEEDFIRRYPDDRDGYLYAGFGERWLNHRCEDALPWYERAFALTPNFYPITKELAECHVDLGEQDAAIATLERYLEIELDGRGRSQALSQLENLQGP